MNRILTKAIVTQFYKINTGFFLVLFLILFGLLNGKAMVEMHMYLMQEISADYRFLLAAMVIWLLYSFKCVLYVHKELRSAAGSYLYVLRSVTDGRHLRLWASCQFQLLLPVTIYTCLTAAVGYSSGHYLYPTLFLLYQTGLCIGAAFIYRDTINNVWRQVLPAMPGIMRGMRKPPYTFLLYYAVNMRKGTFIGLKLLSVILLQGMVAANQVEINKESVAILMMFLIAAHSLLPLYFMRHAETRLAFVRNMPLRDVSILLTVTFTYAVVFLPEITFLILNGRHALPPLVVVELYAVAVSQSMLYTMLHYIPRMNTDRYMLVVLSLFFATLLFLASFDLAPLLGVELLLSVILFVLFYRKYELPAANL